MCISEWSPCSVAELPLRQWTDVVYREGLNRATHSSHFEH